MQERQPYLTPRETQIIQLMLTGKTYPQVAESLKICLPTVKTHMFNAKLRLNADNVKHAIAISIRYKLISV